LSKIFHDKFLTSLYIALIFTPESWGGLGATPFLYQALSGHSVSVTRTSDFIYSIMNLYNGGSNVSDIIFNNIFGLSRNDIDKSKEVSALLSVYPSSNNIITLDTMTVKKILSYLKRIPLNEKFKSISKIADKRDEVLNHYLELFRCNLNSRITSMFIEHSPLSIIDGLIKKVETSRSFFRNSGRMADFRENVFKNNRENYLKFASSKDLGIIDFSDYKSIIEFFEMRNHLIYPNIQFLDMCEPVFETVLNWDVESPVLASATTCDDKNYDYGFLARRFPDIESNSLYKGERENRYLKFEGLYSDKLYKLSNYTRWILEVSGHNKMTLECLESIDVYLAYDYTLSLYNINTPIKLLQRALSGVSGNVAHRLGGTLFRSNTNLHIYPNLLGCISAVIRPDYVSHENLEDSNINFELIIKRVKLAYAIRKNEYNMDKPYCTVNVSNYIDVKDVRINWTRDGTKGVPDNDLRLVDYVLPHNDIIRMEILSHISIVEKVNDDKVMITVADLENTDRDYPNFVSRLSVLQHREQLISNGLLLPDDSGSMELWKSFILKSNNSKVLNNNVDLESEYENILTICQEYPTLFSAYYSKSNDRDLSTSIGKAILDSLRSNIEIIDIVISTLESLNNHQLEKKRLFSIIEKVLLNVNTTMGISSTKQDIKNYILVYIICTVFPYFRTDGRSVTTDLNINTSAISDCYELDVRIDKTLTLYSRASIILRVLFMRNEIKLAVANALSIISSCLDSINLTQLLILPKVEVACVKVNIDINELLVNKDFKYRISKVSEPTEITDRLIYFSQVQADMVSKAYSSLVSLASYTGSDSYTSQYGLYNAMSSVVPNIQYLSILDACSGRGDGNIAMRQLGLRVTSYSTKDIFTSTMSDANTVVVKDLDITNVENLALYTEFDILHFDYSYPRGDLSNFKKVITSDSLRSKIITLRLNSLKPEFISDLIRELSPSRPLYLAYPYRSLIMPYQFYLLIDSEESKSVTYSLECTDSTFCSFKELQNTYRSIVNWSNFTNPGRDLSLNSTNNIITSLPSINKVLTSQLRTLDIADNIAELTVLRETPSSKHVIFLTDELFNIDISKPTKITRLSKEDSLPYLAVAGLYELNVTFKPRQDDKFSAERWKFEKGDNIIEISEITEFSIMELEIISRKHPYKFCRKLAIGYIHLNTFLDSPNISTISEFVNNMSSTVNSSIAINSKRANSISTALEYLAYGLVKNDMKLPYKLLMKSLLSNVKKYKDTIQVILDFRRLQEMKSEWSVLEISQSRKSNFVKLFQKKFGSFISKPLDLRLFVNKFDKRPSPLNESVGSDTELVNLLPQFEAMVTSVMLGVNDPGNPLANLVTTSDDLQKNSFLGRMEVDFSSERMGQFSIGNMISQEMKNMLASGALAHLNKPIDIDNEIFGYFDDEESQTEEYMGD